MNTLKYLIILLGFIYHTSTYSTEPCKKICILSDPKCVTKGGFNVFLTVVNGVKGLIQPLDPLHMEKIEGSCENVKYTLTNITMKGLKNCTVTKLKVNATATEYHQYLHCPKLTSKFHFEAQENTKKPVLRGKGVATICAYNYDIVNYGLYSVFVNEDHRPHFFIITQASKSTPKGKLEVSIIKSSVSETKVNATVKHMNEERQLTESCIFRLIIKKAMEILIHKIDIYIRVKTMGEVLPEKND